VTSTQSMHARMASVLRGERPQHLPLITRIDFWHRHHLYNKTLPEEFRGLSTLEISRALGIGRQATQNPGCYKFHGLEVKVTCNENVVFHQSDPELDSFPTLPDLVPNDIAGTTLTEFITPLGRLTLVHKMITAMVSAGVTRPLIEKHPICAPEDYRIYEYILERAEYVPRFEHFLEAQTDLGEHGWLIPMLDRSPFQNLLLDAIGEIPLFYALHDNPTSIERLLVLLDALTVEKLHKLADLPVPYIEFNDNIEGSMTNPRLFRQHCLPRYQHYADILHAQGKKMGSHTDGNLEPLVDLLAQCGLDVCESFTPHPLTPVTFAQAWDAWRDGPCIWGGIPSYYLEARASQEECEAYIEHILEVIEDGLIILGVVDAIMADNQIERLRWIAHRIEEQVQ
jgi:hypothetical protein